MTSVTVLFAGTVNTQTSPAGYTAHAGSTAGVSPGALKKLSAKSSKFVLVKNPVVRDCDRFPTTRPCGVCGSPGSVVDGSQTCEAPSTATPPARWHVAMLTTTA